MPMQIKILYLIWYWIKLDLIKAVCLLNRSRDVCSAFDILELC